MPRLLNTGLLKKVSLALLALCAVLWLGRGPFQNWMERKLVATLVSKIQPRVPFVIESLELDARWSELVQGKVAMARMRLRQALGTETLHATLAGPLHVVGTEIRYDPEVRIDSQAENPIALRLVIGMSAGFRDLERLSANAEGRRIRIPGVAPPAQAELSSFGVIARWSGTEFQTTLQAGALDFKRDADHLVHIEKIDLNLGGPLTLSPLTLGPIVGGARASRASALQGERYWDLNLKKSPLTFGASFDQSISISNAKAEIPGLKISSDLTRKSLEWKARSLSLAGLMALALEDPPFEIHKGTITGQGGLSWSAGVPALQPGWIEILGLDADFKDAKLAIRGFNSRVSEKGWIEAREIHYQKHRFRLERAHLSALWPRPQGEGAFQISSPAFSLVSPDLTLSLEKIQAQFPVGKSYQIKTSLRTESLPLPAVATGFCISGPLPPGTLALDFSEIEITPSYVDLTGSARAEAFGGALELRELGFFDLDRDVVESFFTAEWKGFDLAKMGEWLNFGKMNGTLQGFANEVVMQSWLPTQFKFRLEARPKDRQDIVFSPDAMRNIVRLFAGPEIEYMPGFARWVAFGWPSRVLGGFDVDYAGITMSSVDGYIRVETLDPAEVVARERKHFILYGPRFKMPLRTSKYPLIVDAPAMGNFVSQVIAQLQAISNRKAQLKEEGNENGRSEKRPCNPSVF